MSAADGQETTVSWPCLLADPDLAQTVAGALEAGEPRGPAAPYWIGLNRDTYAARLADLRRWADTVLGPHYGGDELQDCWSRHIHLIWELSTLAAEWHRTYAGTRPDLARAPECPGHMGLGRHLLHRRRRGPERDCDRHRRDRHPPH
jgi:hypothetical protein